MRILVICDQGVKRSQVLGHQLKYLGHDVLTAGIKTNSPDTLYILMREWSDLIILTDKHQVKVLSPQLGPLSSKIQLWDIGPDVFPEKFNPDLLAKVKQLIRDNPL